MFPKAPFFILMQVVSALNLLLEAPLDPVMAQRHFKTEIRIVVGNFYAYHGLLNFSLHFYCHVASKFSALGPAGMVFRNLGRGWSLLTHLVNPKAAHASASPRDLGLLDSGIREQASSGAITRRSFMSRENF